MLKGTGAIFVAWLGAGCAKPLDTGVVLTPSTASLSDPTVYERLLACARDPRVLTGELSVPVCAAADVFAGNVGVFAAPEARPRSRAAVAPCFVRPTLESFRRDRMAREPDSRF